MNRNKFDREMEEMDAEIDKWTKIGKVVFWFMLAVKAALAGILVWAIIEIVQWITSK